MNERGHGLQYPVHVLRYHMLMQKCSVLHHSLPHKLNEGDTRVVHDYGGRGLEVERRACEVCVRERQCRMHVAVKVLPRRHTEHLGECDERMSELKHVRTKACQN